MQTDLATIVAGVDRSPHSRAALRWAADEAIRRMAALRVVHAWQRSDWGRIASHLPAASARRSQADAVRQETQAWAVELLDRLAVQYTVETVEGMPGPVLVDAAADADQLVVGTGEHVGVDRVLHGSVSHYCVAHAICPVVAVPSRAAQEARAPVFVPRPALE